MKRFLSGAGALVGLVSALLVTSVYAGVSYGSGLNTASGTAGTVPSRTTLVNMTVSAGEAVGDLGLGANDAGNALTGVLVVPAYAGGLVLTQKCSMTETGCTNINASQRSYQAASSPYQYAFLAAGDVTPEINSTYRSCAFMSADGTVGGACTPVLFQGGHAFLSHLRFSRDLATGRTNSVLDTVVLNGQLETALLATWICNGYGSNCSIVQQQFVQSYRPSGPQWELATPPMTPSAGHTYKACVIEAVQGLATAACTPLTVA
jgi:hypothetical protein